MKQMEQNELTKLTAEARMARVRLTGAETKAANAKQKSRQAKRRVKEAKLAARQARKAAKQAKAECLEAKRALAEVEATLMKARAQAEKKKKQETAAKVKPTKKTAVATPPARAGKRAGSISAGLPKPAPSSNLPEQKAIALAAKGMEGMPKRTENGMRPGANG